MKADCQIELYHYPGYGTPAAWEVRVIWQNRLLERAVVGSEFQQGKMAGALEAKWLREWEPEEFQKIVDTKPLASPWCDCCGQDTLKGATSCVGKVFCEDCKHLIPQYVEAARQRTRLVGEAYDDAGRREG